MTAELLRMWIKDFLLSIAPPKEWDLWINHIAELCAPADDYHFTKFRKKWLIKLLCRYHSICSFENNGLFEKLDYIPIDDIIDCLEFYGVWE